MKESADLPLFIQNVLGGGRPGGGLQARTRDDPSLTTTGSKTSLGHSGASEGQRKALELVNSAQNLLQVMLVPQSWVVVLPVICVSSFLLVSWIFIAVII